MPGEAVVIRGGRDFDRRRAMLNALDEHARTGRFGLSVASRPDRSADELAAHWTYRGQSYQSSSVKEIRNLADGFDVVEDGDEVHALLLLPRAPQADYMSDPMWDDVSAAFAGPPSDNPTYVP